jgi:hypothetical protein
VLVNPVYHEHWVAGAPLGVLDRTPSRRDDMAVHHCQACSRSVHIAPVTEADAERGDRHSGSKSRED